MPLSFSLFAQALFLGVAVVSLIAFIAVFSLPLSPNVTYTPPGKPRDPGTTFPLELLRAYAVQQTNYVEGSNSFWRPAALDQVREARILIGQAPDYPGLVLPQQISSGTALGYNPLVRLPQDREKLAAWWPFNFDYSSVGWYWLFGTFDTAFYICYVVRMQVACPEVRKEVFGGGSGPQTTCYFLSLGVGEEGKDFWRTPFMLAGGEYEEGENFGWTLKTSGATINSLAAGHFRLEGTFQGATVALQAVFPENPVLNGFGGDAPRVAGTGTSYWSYTNGTAQLQFQRSASDPTQTFAGGYAWMDRQVIRADSPNSTAGALGWNLANMGRSTRGLAPYVWIVIRVDGEGQYMIVATPLPSDSAGQPLVAVKQQYDAIYMFYPPDNSNPDRARNTTLTVERTSGAYPTEYSVKLRDGKLYNLIGSQFGEAYTIDPSNSPHWSGGCFVYTAGSRVGRGLLEANGFQPTDQGIRNSLQAAAPEKTPSQQQVDIFSDGSQLTPYWQWMTALTVVALVVVVALILSLSATIPATRTRPKIEPKT